MCDAISHQNEFKRWSSQQVMALLIELFNKCLSPTGWNKTKDEFRGVSSTVNLEDYRRACNDRPELKQCSPEDLCVNSAVMVALQALPENKALPFGREGEIELHFDGNELFRSKLEQPWRENRNNVNSFWSLIASINSAN